MGAPCARRKQQRDVAGILLLDKPTGITSNAALQRAKRCFQARKAGHTGSLDPLASGMLPLCFGHATKVSGMLLEADKVYEVEAVIGTQTDTADADGAVVQKAGEHEVTPALLAAAISAHLGTISQVPPMYSALKHRGRRLHELAREGIEVERPPRRVQIHSIEVARFDPVRPRLRVQCSKGTYIRTLVETLAAHMGTLAHVGALRRLWVEPFETAPMVSLAEIERLAGNHDALDAHLLGADAALPQLPPVQLDARSCQHLAHGRPVPEARERCPGYTGLVRAYGPNQRFLGVAELLDDGRLVVRRLFDRGATVLPAAKS